MAAGFRDLLAFVLGWHSSGDDPTLTVPDKPGLEYTLPTNRLHATLTENALHATLRENRLHYTLNEEDG